LLLQELSDLSAQPNFTSILCRALQSNGLSGDFLTHFVKTSQLPFSQVLLIALGLAQSFDTQVREEGLKFLRSKLQDFAEFNTERLPNAVLRQLIYFIKETDSLQAKQKLQFISMLESIYPDACASITKTEITQSSVDMDPLISALASTCTPGDMIRDVGYAALESQMSFTEFLAHFPPPSSDDVAGLIVSMMQTLGNDSMMADASLPTANVLAMAGAVAKSPRAQAFAASPEWQAYARTTEESEREGNPLTKWNISVFVRTLQALFPTLDWMDVPKRFDTPGFFVADAESFALVLEVFQLATPGANFPIDIVFSKWSNRAGQVSLMRQVMQTPPHLFSFLSSPRTLSADESQHSASDSLLWLSLDLLESMLALTETEVLGEVSELIMMLQQRAPELLICGLLQTRPRSESRDGARMRDDILAALMPHHLLDSLHRLWASDPGVVVQWLDRLYGKYRAEGSGPDLLARLVAFAKEMEPRDDSVLTRMLNSSRSYLALDLAGAATSANMLDLDQWLKLRVDQQGAAFGSSCLDYLRDRPLSELSATAEAEIASSVYKFLAAGKAGLGAESVTEVERMYKASCDACPQLKVIDIHALTDAFPILPAQSALTFVPFNCRHCRR
jgi:hypothetical protein